MNDMLLHSRRNPFLNPENRRQDGGVSESDSNSDSDNDALPDQSPSVVNGMEVMPLHIKRDMQRGEFVYHRDRDRGALQERNRLWTEIANKYIPPEETDLMVKRLEKRADRSFQRTYIEGVPIPEVLEAAPVLKVGLNFLPGADKPQVNRTEETNMSSETPDPKTALWRVATAGALLTQFEVTERLEVAKTDRSNAIAKRARERLRKPQGPSPNTSDSQSARTELEKRTDIRAAVTIDSDEVSMVNILSYRDFDLCCTLIEVDGTSLVSMMINFRHIISRGGPDMSFYETSQLLDTMIEDARRLCIRSPILFRMSTRSKIINSRDTRYGIDDGSLFRTLTTSKGIREIISLSASYYNSLDPAGSKDSTQKMMRPRFLQMVVLLLSLLNNGDLEGISDFLEATYGLRAARRDLELLFLKVIPLISINSRVFLESMVPAFEGHPLLDKLDTKSHDCQSHFWNIFVRQILRADYLLPGTIENLGRDEFSWIVKWPKTGFKSSEVFDNLQYNGSHSRTMNEIPPIVLHHGADMKELTVIMTNGNKYSISSADLEKITCLQEGVYTVRESRTNGKVYDLNIQEVALNKELRDAIKKTNDIIAVLNPGIAKSRNSNQGRSLTKLTSFRGRNAAALGLLDSYTGSGRLTKHMAYLNADTLATAYKLEGRKLHMIDCIRNMSQDLTRLQAVTRLIENRASVMDLKRFSNERRHLRLALEEIGDLMALAEGIRENLRDTVEIADEPVAKVLYPQGLDLWDPDVWFEYNTWYRTSDRALHVESRRAVVSEVNWVSNEVVDVRLRGDETHFYATPLKAVDEVTRDEEVEIGDVVLLAGQVLIIAEKVDEWEIEIGVAVGGEDENEADEEAERGAIYSMTNCLKITGVEEVRARRRRRNRGSRPERSRGERTETIFR